MRYIVHAVLSSFLPNSRRAKMVLAGAALIAVVALTWIILRRSPANVSPYAELALRPLEATDANGNRWRVELAVAQPFASVRQSGVEPGPPLHVKTDVQKHSASEVSIGLVLEGQAGERYRPDIRRNGTVLPAPEFRVMDQKGRVVFADAFKYG